MNYSNRIFRLLFTGDSKSRNTQELFLHGASSIHTRLPAHFALLTFLNHSHSQLQIFWSVDEFGNFASSQQPLPFTQSEPKSGLFCAMLDLVYPSRSPPLPTPPSPGAAKGRVRVLSLSALMRDPAGGTETETRTRTRPGPDGVSNPPSLFVGWWCKKRSAGGGGRR